MLNRKAVAIVYFSFISVLMIYGSEVPALKNIKIAREAFREKDYYTAIEYYKASLQSNPRFTNALYGLSLTYFRLNQFEESLKYILKARKIDKNETSLMVLQGRIYTALGRFNEAFPLFTEALQREPNNVDAKIGRAELFVAEGNIIDAISIYNNTLLNFPDNKRTLLSLIIILDSRGLYSKADPYVSHLLRMFPNDSVVQYTAARHFQAENLPDRIEKYAEAAVALDKNNKDAVLLLSKIYVKQKRYSDAEVLLQKVLKVNRSQPLVWYMLAEVYRLDKRNNKALQAYSIALSLQPEDEIIRIAFEAFIEDTKLPNDPVRKKYADFHFQKGKELETKDYIDKAREEYRRGLFIAPHSASGWLLYANLVKKEGYISRYLSILKEVEKIDPNSRDLKDNIEIYQSLISNTVASKWKINQFEVQKQNVKIGIYSGVRNDFENTAYFNADYYINRNLKNLLLGAERVDVINLGEKKAFSESFKLARRNKCDYFLMVDSSGNNMNFSLSADLYHGKTGALLKKFSIYRTGNGKVSSALQKLSDSMQALIPLSGKIIKRSADKVLVNLGRIDGIKPGMVFSIVESGYNFILDDQFRYNIPESHLLGEVKIDAVDDLVSEGVVKKYTFFDLINVGNDIIIKSEHKKSSKEQHPAGYGEISSEMYKTILTLP